MVTISRTNIFALICDDDTFLGLSSSTKNKITLLIVNFVMECKLKVHLPVPTKKKGVGVPWWD
jgi:hypothetical protein